MSDTPAAVAPASSTSPVREKIGRGTLFALLTIPVGVAAWVVVWGLGYIASIVGAVVAFLAMRLYVWGAGRISRVGAVVVLAVTVVTLVLAFLAGIAYDAVVAFSDASGMGRWETLTHPEFGPLFAEILPEALPEYQGDLLWALGFGALGSFAVLRGVFLAGAAPQADAAQADGSEGPAWTPDVPAAQPAAEAAAPSTGTVAEPPAGGAQSSDQA